MPKSIRLSDGQPCHLLDGGDGYPLLFVHGLPGLGSDFLPLAQRMVTRYRCILVDRPGYGLSPLSVASRPMSVERSAQDVQDILAQLALQEVVLVGWSYGGHIVANVATSASDLVSAVVLLGAAGPRLQWPINGVDRLLFKTELGPVLLKLVKRTAPWILRRGLSDAIGQPASDALFNDFLASLHQPGMIENWIREGQNWQPTAMQPEALQQPCLILHGEQDTRVPASVAREMASRICRAKYIELADAGHWPFLTHSQRVEQEIISFLQR